MSFICIEKIYLQKTNSRTCSFADCLCYCGQKFSTRLYSIKKGHTKSCGCWNRCYLRTGNPTHGMTYTSEYKTYLKMVSRCSNLRSKDYSYYGGRGIRCLFSSFEEFYAEVGTRPTSNHSIDRIDNNGHYEPGNVRWALRKQQNRNQRSNIKVAMFGQTQILTDWCKGLGLVVGSVRSRVKRKKVSHQEAIMYYLGQQDENAMLQEEEDEFDK